MKITIDVDAQAASTATGNQPAMFEDEGDGTASDGGAAQAGSGAAMTGDGAEQDGGEPPQSLRDAIAASEAVGSGEETGFGGLPDGSDGGAGPTGN